MRTLLLDHGNVDFVHAEDGDKPLEGTIHVGHVHDHPQGGPVHEFVDGGEARKVRAGRSGHQGDGGERSVPGGAESLGLHGVEPAGEEGSGHRPTTPVIGRVEGSAQDAVQRP